MPSKKSPGRSHVPAADSAPDAAPEPSPKAKVPAGAAHRQIVDLCPIPLFQLDGFGNILWANDPFCEFAKQKRRELVGRAIHDTRLGVVYAEVADDVRRCVEQTQPPTLKRILRFVEQDGREVAWLCWLVPETNVFGKVLRLFGYLHPLGE